MTGPYGRWIADYRDGGLHPFPVDGKRPCVTSYAKRRPSAATTERWAQTFPAANLGLPTRREGLAVLDADDPGVVALFEAVAGFTPLRVGTRRGEHWYFGDPRGEIAGANHPLGQPFDIKAAGSPPELDASIHANAGRGSATITLSTHEITSATSTRPNASRR